MDEIHIITFFNPLSQKTVNAEERCTKARGEGPFPLWLPVPRARFTEVLGGSFP